MSSFHALSQCATNLDRRNIAALDVALIPAKSFIKPRRHPIKGEIKEEERIARKERERDGRDAVHCSRLVEVANIETHGGSRTYVL